MKYPRDTCIVINANPAVRLKACEFYNRQYPLCLVGVLETPFLLHLKYFSNNKKMQLDLYFFDSHIFNKSLISTSSIANFSLEIKNLSVST